ncbi:protocadherin gamma-C5-like isoform X23 [Spea bombifrons]|uniref:protocadherin gamma-C5-like isoform X23 n=1 Tax=Spea bombifrons TaxID=233779 RepID=UPI00234AB365|nr:protocadherin gamma-C5-like isoform X23 [Spea bombifrons]
MDQATPKAWKWQVAFSFLLCSWGWVSGQVRYSILEESDPGTIVGNIAQDLGLNLADISKRRLHLGSEDSRRHFAVNQESGALTVRERIDRENLCGSSSSCLLHTELVAENPLELFRFQVEVLDINDNSPFFSTSNRMINITEIFASPGNRFPLGTAQDLDVGSNGISQYKINPSPYFSLSVKSRKDGTLIPELVLEKALDREEKGKHNLILIALDGAEPPRSGSTQITVLVLDINDNAPIFDQSTYKIKLLENVPLQTAIITLNATDLDEGTNGEVEYYFDDYTSDIAKDIFDLNAETGDICIKGNIDFEESHFYELSVRAKDRGVPALEGHCLIQIEVEDVNDNPPEIIITSMSYNIPENTALGTAVVNFSIIDRDSGKNGQVKIEILKKLPFIVKPFENHYSLVINGLLDRESISEYNIQVTATDLGAPPLSTLKMITLSVSDINDNTPVFSQSYYNAFIKENNDPGRLLCTVSAFDPDEGINSELIYSVVESDIEGSSVSSFIYINPNNGNIYSQRSFDYEHIQMFKITVQVEDSGIPKLYSSVTVFIFVLDANDNTPTVLNSDEPNGQISIEKIPVSVSAGYLVSKVSAVDLDSGYNAWLSFRFAESTKSTLFEVTESTGEIRIVRTLHDTDDREQQLVILVSDHGDPPLTTTVTVLIHLVEDILQESPNSHAFLPNSKPTLDLTLYLIFSLVAISVVSLVTFIILLVKCLKGEHEYASFSCCFLSSKQSKSYTDQYQPTLCLNTNGTLKFMEVRMLPPGVQGQCYKTSLPPTTDTYDLNSQQMKNILSEAEPSSYTDLIYGQDQAQPNTEWRFSQAQRPGPSGAQPTEEAGVWPNNQFETERLQAMILASANEAAEGTSGLGGGTGTMGLSARYGPQFTLQHVPDYRQNVYIPGSTLTPTNAAGKRDGKSGGNKKKSGKKEKK